MQLGDSDYRKLLEYLSKETDIVQLHILEYLIVSNNLNKNRKTDLILTVTLREDNAN